MGLTDIIVPSDGERGQIHFRGYDIGYLFENHEYEEVVFLLMYGNLPSAEEAQAFRRGLVAELKAPKVVVDTIHAFPYVPTADSEELAS
jgi:citrate synthase